MRNGLEKYCSEEGTSKLISNRMKSRTAKYPLLLFWYLSAWCILGCTNIHHEKDLQGTWRGEKGHVEVLVKFEQDATFEFIYTDPGSKTEKITGEYCR